MLDYEVNGVAGSPNPPVKADSIQAAKPTEAEQATSELSEHYQQVAKNTDENENEIKMIKDLIPAEPELKKTSGIKKFFNIVRLGVDILLHPKWALMVPPVGPAEAAAERPSEYGKAVGQ